MAMKFIAKRTSVFLTIFFLTILPSVSPGQDFVRQTIRPDEELVTGRTTLWSPAFQHCWDNLLEMHNVDAIELQPPNSYAKYLNEFQWNADQSLPPHGFITIVGEDGASFVETVNKAILTHFGRTVAPLDPKDWPDPIAGGIALFTVMKRSIAFGSGFEERTDSSFPFFNQEGGVKDVRAFGAWTAKQRIKSAGTARVLAYIENGKQGLALSTDSPDDFVVLLHDPEQKSIMAAIEETKRLLSSVSARSDTLTTKLDTILIPQLKLSNLGKFEKQLSGKYRTPGMAPDRYFEIVKACQNIDLSFDQTGADMETRTFLISTTFLSSDTPSSEPAKKTEKAGPRNFVFNKPFFLMLWSKNGTVPYLACYVDTAGLVPWSDD